MPTSDDIHDQQTLLATHRRTLAHYVQQQAALGSAFAPPGVAHGIHEAQTNIARIKATLREWGVLVGDHPDDERAPLPPAPPPRDLLHQLRAPTRDFVGRTEEIARLEQDLLAGNGTAAICGVRGMGGIGKTELAYAVAARLLSRFPDAQIVVELFGASNPLSPERALQSVLRACEPAAKLPDDLPTLKQLYTAYLHGRRALILADDARDTTQVRHLLPPPGCALLITSRSHIALPGIHPLDLGTLPLDEAVGLLLGICPRIGEHAAALAKLCGCLPLALRVSADLLANDETRPVPRYLKQLEQERLRHLRDPDNPDDPAASVEASLTLSYNALPPPVQHAFAQLGVFTGSFTYEALLAVVDGTDAEEAASLLYRRSLLDYDEANARYDLHDLARVFARARLDDERPARLRHARYYQQVANYAQMELYLKGKPLEGLALFDQERQQIDAAWGWARASVRALERASVQAPAPASEQDVVMDTLLLVFANATVYVGDLRYGVRNERIPQLEAQAAAARRMGRKEQEGYALGNLGIAYDALGDYARAIEYHEQHLAIAREIGDRRGEGAALGSLGLAYQNLGDYARAIGYYEQAMAIDREIGNREGVARHSWNLGLLYEQQGDLARAEPLMAHAAAFMQQIGHAVYAQQCTDGLARVREKLRGGGS